MTCRTDRQVNIFKMLGNILLPGIFLHIEMKVVWMGQARVVYHIVVALVDSHMT